MDYVALFKFQEKSADLESRIDYSNAAQTNKTTSTISSTSVKETSPEASVQIASVNEPQEDEYYSDVVSMEQAYLSFRNTYSSLRKIMVKLNVGASMSLMMIFIYLLIISHQIF